MGGRFCLGRGTWMFTGRVGNTSIKCQEEGQEVRAHRGSDPYV